MPYSYNNGAEYCSIIFFEHFFFFLYSYTCGSQVKAQPSSGHIFPARSCVRIDCPSEAIEVVSYCTQNGRMSRKLGIGEIPFHHHIAGDIDDVQDHRYRMSRRTFSNPGKNVPGIMLSLIHI